VEVLCVFDANKGAGAYFHSVVLYRKIDRHSASQIFFSEADMANLILQTEQRTTQYYRESMKNGVSLDMVLIPGGTFWMGSPNDEIDRQKTESPQHEVTVPSFFMGRYPVTQAQWRFVAELPMIDRSLESDPSRFKGDNRPVEQVSWHDAIEFCRRLAQKTGRPYRLPSEAEWEYACRAGTTTPFHFGKTITSELANYDGSGSYADGEKGEYRQETTPVDRFGFANAFGLCEMHGNVWEWCEDHWHSHYEGAPVDGSAWHDLEADENAERVVRGGSWFDVPLYCRSASRSCDVAGFRFYIFGFRVVCFAPRTP
jgi:formylglycine-generating enzyme required for sulfatase activity